MNKRKIIVIYKKSTFQMYEKIINSTDLKKRNKKLYTGIVMAHKEHLDSVDILKKKFKNSPVPVLFHRRGDKKMPRIGDDDIVMAVGGDGTFIFASHYVKNGLMIGVNSAPDFSIGHYCKYNLFDKSLDLISEIQKVIDNKQKITNLNRLKVTINGNTLGIPVINDMLIIDKNPATTTRYIIDFNGNQYYQKSSGIWISTAMGSSAAFRSCGGKIFSQYNSKKEKQFGCIIREIYRPEAGTYRGGMITEKDNIIVTMSNIEGSIYIDGGQKVIKLFIGDVIEIGFQEDPLRAILK